MRGVFFITVLFLVTGCSLFFFDRSREVFIKGVEIDENQEIYFSSYSSQHFKKVEDNSFVVPKRQNHTILKLSKEGFRDKYIVVQKTRNLSSMVDVGISAVSTFRFLRLASDAVEVPENIIYGKEEKLVLLGIVSATTLSAGSYVFFSKKYGVVPKNIDLSNINFEPYIERKNNQKSILLDEMTVDSYNTALGGQSSVPSKMYRETPLFASYDFLSASKSILSKSGFNFEDKNKLDKQYVKVRAHLSNFKVSNGDIFYEEQKYNQVSAVEAKVKWEVIDKFTDEILEEIIIKCSSPQLFFMDTSMHVEYANTIMYEAIEKLIAHKSFIPYLERIDFEEQNTEKIILSQVNVAKRIEEAHEACVVVRFGKGQIAGFLISDEGYIITTSDVVGREGFKVQKNGVEVGATLIRFDLNSNLALLKIDEIPKGFINYIIPFGTPKEDLGKELYVLGTSIKSESFNKNITKGIVSGFRNANEIFYLQSNVALNPEAYGAPVVNINGELIGVSSVQTKDVGTERLNFLLSAPEVLRLLNLNVN